MRRLTLAVTILTAGITLAGCAASDAGSSGHEGHDSSPAASSQSSTSVASDADVMFASMMIPHHEQAVEMSEIVLAKPDLDARIADLATRIRDAQAPEITQMREWLDAWGAEASDHAGHGMHGMLSNDDIAALEAASGPEAGRLYLEGMITHHEGAVAMAEDEIANGSDPDAIALAEAIVETQQAEIDEMHTLLAEL